MNSKLLVLRLLLLGLVAGVSLAEPLAEGARPVTGDRSVERDRAGEQASAKGDASDRSSLQLAGSLPNDAGFGLQWGLLNTGQEIEGVVGAAGADMGLPDAWGLYSGRAWTRIAIVGTGVDPHPEFADRLDPGRAMVGDWFDTRDQCGVGTHLAGILAAATNNGVGIAGIHDRARILPVRVTDGCAVTAAAVAAGIVWAVDAGADVVLVASALGTSTQALQDAVSYAQDADIVVVAPVGDSAASDPTYPAAYPTCLGVSATTSTDGAAGSSGFGAHVDVAAPGESIYSTTAESGLGYRSGTAPAAAAVAGLASLLRSYAPHLDALSIRALIQQGGEDLGPPGVDPAFGFGRIDAFSSLAMAPVPALRFEPGAPPRETVTPDGSAGIAIRVLGVGETLDADSVQLIFRAGDGPFSAVPMALSAPEVFSATWPELPCGSRIEYFITATSTLGTTVLEPLDAPVSLHHAEALRFQAVFEDDFEVDRGWTSTFGGDSATTGQWTRVVPVGTSAQPPFDYSSNERAWCFVTGQHAGGGAGSNDVDFGPVSLVSPVIDLPAGALDYEIRYARWFHTTAGAGQDSLVAQASLDGGATWPLAVEVMASSTEGWEPFRVRLSDLAPAAGHQFRLRFVTSDLQNDSLTEAAIDEVSVLAIHCRAVPGDVDGSGSFDGVDYRSFASCWSGPGVSYPSEICAPFDADHDGDVDMEDVGELFTLFGPP